MAIREERVQTGLFSKYDLLIFLDGFIRALSIDAFCSSFGIYKYKYELSGKHPNQVSDDFL